MLANSLNTNEIKNATALENEFQRIKLGDGRTEFARIGESPALPHRLIVSHLEVGTGVARRRRSVTEFNSTQASVWDGTKFVKDRVYIVVDRSIGAQSDDGTPKLLLANLGSFMFTLGGTSTFLYDGTGTGSANLLSGGV
jgi:hypothetical protein